MQDLISKTTGMHHEVAVLEKGGLFSVVALTITTGGIVMLGRNDPRNEPPVSNSVQHCREGGGKNFENSIRHSQDNGWRLVWRGFPYGRPNA
jgi:hypothetical protein